MVSLHYVTATGYDYLNYFSDRLLTLIPKQVW